MKRAFYDLAVSPYSFDFATFAMCARAHECDEIIIVPGTRIIQGPDGKLREFQKCTPEEQTYRMQHLILALCPDAKLLKSREEAKDLWHEGCYPDNYTVDRPVASHMTGHLMRSMKIFPFMPTKEYAEEVQKDWPGNKVVAITIRETHIKPLRNSAIEEWIKAADWMHSIGLEPVFVPDTESVDRVFGGHRSAKKAALNVQYRLALYEKAYLNVGVNNGPMALNLFSKRSVLYLRPVCNAYPESTLEMWNKQGIPYRSQPPWFSRLQRIIWEGEDDYENIKANVEKWLSAKEEGKDLWPLAAAPKYPIQGVVNPEGRHAQMAKALEIAKSRGWPQMLRKNHGDKWLSIVGFGPSLKHTWRHIKRPMLTVSGAHDFLLDCGVVPDYHMDCDPRDYKADFVKRAHPGVLYLMASVCHPKVWDYLEGMKVELWHLHNGAETSEWVAKHDPGANMIGGGSTAGMRALEIGSMLGYRRFEIHGIDNSLAEGKRHAGPHPGKEQNIVQVNCDEGWYDSTPQMIEAAKEMITFIQNYDCEITFYGEGLQQAMVDHFRKRFTIVPMSALKELEVA